MPHLLLGPLGLTVDFLSGIQLNVLLRPYLCCISFLYLDLFVLGDDSMISQGSFMQTKHLSDLIHIRIKGDVCTARLV